MLSTLFNQVRKSHHQTVRNKLVLVLTFVMCGSKELHLHNATCIELQPEFVISQGSGFLEKTVD